MTASPVPTLPAGEPTDRRHLGLVLLALATGGFAIGTTEFVSMGLLPQLARGVDASIPATGHAISAYALGVVVGAPLIAFVGSRWPRRATPPRRRRRAVAKVMLGLSVANLVGVPTATWLGQNFGWRSAYWVVAGLGLLTLVLVLAFVPTRPGDREGHWRRELKALGDAQVLLTLFAGAVGFGGMFAVYTYIVPTLTEVGGLPESAAPVFLFAFGLGMVAGTWLAGELTSWSVFRSMFIGGAGQGLLLLLFALVAPAGWWALPVAFGITTTGSILVVALQLRLMRVAGDAETIGAAMNHASLNIANAIGAWVGGLVVAAGWGYRAPGVVGFALSLLGLAALALSARLHLGQRRAR